MGAHALTGYHCENFVSCVHCDEDVDGGVHHPCFQTLKENCGPNDFNFAYVEWNVAIRTNTNALWYVFEFLFTQYLLFEQALRRRRPPWLDPA